MAAVMHQLVLRGTFIDSIEVSSGELKRARSFSPSKKSFKDDLFGVDSEYVRTLVSKSDQVFGSPKRAAPVFAEPVKLTPANLKAISKGAPEKSQSGRLTTDAFGSASTTASGLTTASTATKLSWANVTDDLDLDSDIDINDYKERVEPEVPVPDFGSEASTEDDSSCNLGSAGHPELCMHPCIYFAAGNCASGKSCNFCHMSHQKRSVHLDKRKRDTLKAMTYPEVAALCQPLLEEKAVELNLTADANMLIEMLVNSPGCSLSPDAEAQVGQRAQKALAKTLASMTFITLVLLVTTRPDAPESVKGSEVQDAISRVRFAPRQQ